MVSLYKTHGEMCTSASKSISSAAYSPSPDMIVAATDRDRGRCPMVWPIATNEADRARLREAQDIWSGARRGGATNTTNSSVRNEELGPCKGRSLNNTTTTNTSVRGNHTCVPSPSHIPGDYILQQPSARALLVLGYQCEDIKRAVNHLQCQQQHITAEKLFCLINDRDAVEGVGSQSQLQIDCAANESASVDQHKRGCSLSKGQTSDEKRSTSPRDSRAALSSLIEETRRLKLTVTCKVCLCVRVDTLFLPCRHLVCCEQCATKLQDCCVCRRVILGTVKTYI